MKKIDAVLRELTDGGWRDNVRRAAEDARLQTAVQHMIRAAGFDEISCRAELRGDEVLLRAPAAAAAMLRQMQSNMLPQLQKEFPEIKRLRFGSQF